MCDQQIEFKRCPWALKKRFVKCIHITSQINNVFTPFLLFFFPEAYFFSCRELSFNLLLFFKNKTIQCNQPNKIWTHWYKMQNEEPTGFFFFPFWSWTCVTLSPKKANHCDAFSPQQNTWRWLFFLTFLACLYGFQSWLLQTDLSIHKVYYKYCL